MPSDEELVQTAEAIRAIMRGRIDKLEWQSSNDGRMKMLTSLGFILTGETIPNGWTGLIDGSCDKLIESLASAHDEAFAAGLAGPERVVEFDVRPDFITRNVWVVGAIRTVRNAGCTLRTNHFAMMMAA